MLSQYARKFQSLFQWMSFFNNRKAHKAHSNLTVSILVLVDVFLQLQETCTEMNEKLGFQSLFQWMSFFNIPITITSSWSKCSFNPYFSGCLSSIRERLNLKTQRLYVSILVLVDVFLQYLNPARLVSPSKKFQSLFQWMSFFNPR